MQTYVCPCLGFAPRSRARDKVCHPELVSGSELAAKHTSPYPLLLRRGANETFASLELKEKIFEDDSENRVRACPEKDFSFCS